MHNFTKLRLWQWTDLAKIVYLDADTIATQNLDDMFLAPAFSAVMDNMAADEQFTAARFQVPSFRARSSHDEPERSYFNVSAPLPLLRHAFAPFLP
jgi:alpha-N-acetylglucosamine transferase